MIELKNCPFCGGQPRLYRVSKLGNRYSILHECDSVKSDIHRESKAEAIHKWNTRAAPEGMVLVPAEPTKHMIEEAYYSRNCFISGSDDSGSIYKAMIKAAQEG